MEFNVQQIYWGLALVITLMQERAKKQDWAEGNVEQRCGFSKGVYGFLGELWDPLGLSQIQARCRVLLLLLIAYGTTLTSLPSTEGGAQGELSCKLYSWHWQNELQSLTGL